MARGWTNKLDETMELDKRSGVPSIWLSVEHALNTFGGWARMFSKSSTTYDQEVIVHRESDPGFWVEFGKARAMDQFDEAIAEAVQEFRTYYPDIKMPIKELRRKLATALLQDGWRPVKAPIVREIRALRKKKREEIKSLRGGRTKKEWLRYLKEKEKK
jgi:hypothetical protein